MENLSRDIERQVGRVHHAAHKTQIIWQELLGVFHDEDPLDIELKAMPLLTIVQVEGCLARNEQQLCVLGSAFHTIVGVGQGLVHAVGNALVELLVLLIGDLTLGPGPEGGGLVHGLPVVMLDILRLLFIPLALLHLNWNADVIGVALENFFDGPMREQVVMTFLVLPLPFGLT